VIALASLTSFSEACSPDPRFFKLSYEQQISREELIFIGKIKLVFFGKVAFVPEEVLRGPKKRFYVFDQGHGTDCQQMWEKGKRVLFAGTLSFGPSRGIEGPLQKDVEAVIKKLRQKRPLKSVPAGFFE
jgi:hypothetical protein